MVKKICTISMVLILAMCLQFWGCGNSQTNDEQNIGQESEYESDQNQNPDQIIDPSRNQNSDQAIDRDAGQEPSQLLTVVEDKYYWALDEVAEYIYVFSKLPQNYLTKNQAMDMGWESDKGNLWEVTDRGVIGGDKFGNREGLLPKEKGRVWYECDVNYEGGFRTAERLVYSNDGLIYYTNDHYKSFERLY